MKCVILAAGYATRLYPLTLNFPKPLLEVGGKAILDWLIDDLSTGNRIDEFILVSNHMFFSEFEKWAAGRAERIIVIDDGSVSNETRLGAVRDVLFALQKIHCDDGLLVIAGDNLLDFSLTRFIDYAKKKDGSCIMRYYEQDEEKLHRTGVVSVSGDDTVVRMTEKPAKPESNWASPPFYYYTAGDTSLVQKGIDAGCGTDSPGSFIAWLCEQTRVYAMEMPGKRYDIGDMRSYTEIKNSYKGII